MRTLMDDSSLSSRRKKKQAGIFLKRKAYNLWFAVVVVGTVECGKREKTLAIKGKAFPQTFHSIFSFSTAFAKEMRSPKTVFVESTANVDNFYF